MGARQKNIECKGRGGGGRVTKRILSSFAVTASVIIGTLRSEDGDGRENVAEKVNSRSFNLHRD